MTPLWTIAGMAAAMRADKHGALPESTNGVSIDSRGRQAFRMALQTCAISAAPRARDSRDR